MEESLLPANKETEKLLVASFASITEKGTSPLLVRAEVGDLVRVNSSLERLLVSGDLSFDLQKEKVKPDPEIFELVEEEASSSSENHYSHVGEENVYMDPLVHSHDSEESPEIPRKGSWREKALKRFVGRLKSKSRPNLPDLPSLGVSNSTKDLQEQDVMPPGKGKQVGWSLSTRKLFGHEKRIKQLKGSNMATIKLNYLKLQGKHNTGITLDLLNVGEAENLTHKFLCPDLTTDVDNSFTTNKEIIGSLEKTHSTEGSKNVHQQHSQQSKTGSFKLKNHVELMHQHQQGPLDLNTGLEWDDSLPLLAHPDFEGDAVKGSAQSSMTSEGSTRLLGIHPAKDMIFKYDAVQKSMACTIKMENSTDIFVAFKMQVKGSSPERYLAKPNKGVIAPNTRIEVTVLKVVQKGPMPLSPYRKERTTEKFVIITLPLPPGTSDKRFSKISSSIFENNKLLCRCERVLCVASGERDKKPIPNFEGSLLFF